MSRSRISRPRWQFNPHNPQHVWLLNETELFKSHENVHHWLPGYFVMRNLTAIVAANEEGAIGAGNALPWRVKSDLRFFRQQTIGNILIMGRKTYDSLDGPLLNRTNIVVTHSFNLFPDTSELMAAGGIEEALARADKLAGSKKKVFIVGGVSMYVQFAPYVDRYLITEVQKHVTDADAFLPPDLLGDMGDWHREILQSGDANDVGDEAAFTIFELTSRQPDRAANLRNEAIDHITSKGRRARLSEFEMSLRLTG